MAGILIRNAQLDGRVVDVHCLATVQAIAAGLTPAGAQVIDAKGGALLPGLHDHHLHFFAAAAAAGSMNLAGLSAGDAAALSRALRSAPGDGWLRGIGYHESLAGNLDRYQLDRLVGDRPIRLQHASGKMWLLNSRALQLLDVESAAVAGIERDARGAPTGRLFRLDDWLRERLRGAGELDLASYSKALARVGITSFTDASYTNGAATATMFEQARAAGRLLQQAWLMGDEALAAGPLKIMLDEDNLPDLDDLTARIAAAHDAGRSVAAHCVARVELVMYLQALRAAGALPGDRVEHGAMIGDDLLPLLRELGVTVVTQPGFLAARGDRYRRDNPARDWPELYRYASLLRAGVPVVASSDAPYGPVDPWQIIAAATQRRTPGGQVLGATERVTARQALAGYLSRPDDPVGSAREIAVGAAADICVLDRSLEVALAEPAQVSVRATIIAGRLVYDNSANTSSVCSPS